MYRSLLVKNCRVIQTKGLLVKNAIVPVASRVFLHSTANLKNNGVNSQDTKQAYSTYTKNNYNIHGTLDNTLGAKLLALFVAGGALYFVSPKKHTSKKQDTQLNDLAKNEQEEEKEEEKAENIIESLSTENNEVNNNEELEDLETVDGETFSETEEEVNKEGAYNPETGEINWDCPCLGGMAHGPCGEEFKEAFACFVYSEADPKGIDCVEKFQKMQDCFRKYPEHYAEQLKDEEEINQQLEQEVEQTGSNLNITEDFVEIENPENLTNTSNESSPDITVEETVVVEDVAHIEGVNHDEIAKELTETVEEIELTENS